MPKINREEYEILISLDERAKSIVRQDGGRLWVAEQPIMKDDIGWYVEDGFDVELEDDEIHLFQFIQWEDSEPYNIAELIEEYEYSTEHVSHVVNERVRALGNAWKESEETEVKKDIDWLKKWAEDYMDRANEILSEDDIDLWMRVRFSSGLSVLDELLRKINQLDGPEQPKITLQDVTDKLWELPLNNRKFWLARLNDEFQEGYIVPLGLKTTDGEEQYLTYNGSYFASRRNKYLQQTFDTLEEIPEFYRGLAERVL